MPSSLFLKPHEIHLWSACLTRSIKQEEDDFALLNNDEQNRANQFKVAKARQYFIAARSLLRTILGHYLNIAPKVVVFSYGADKKPQLAALHQSPITFNVSHSDCFALFAIGHHTHVGVDIEKIRQRAYLEIAQRFFNEEEWTYLKTAPFSEQVSAFYQLWVRKEALLKATGRGLTLPLNQCAVLAEEASVEIDKKMWFYKTLSTPALGLPAGFQAAIASDAPLMQLVCHGIWRDKPA